MKLCISCAYYRPCNPPAPAFARCADPAVAGVNPVDGSPIYGFCAERRKAVADCGPNAVYFVADPAS